MDDLKNDPELERMFEKINLKLPPEHIMRDYASGVHLKIEARKQFLFFAIPITSAVISIGAVVLILLCVFWHPNYGKNMHQITPITLALPSPITTEQKTLVSQQAKVVSVAEINREIKILRALGEDPTEVITETMDINQLAKELAYWDEVAMRSYRQIASSEASAKF